MTSERLRRRDAGMTLIELVVTITVIGAIATVLAAAVTVTFRQQADTRGNLDVARWEQALALWLPTDLASADLTPPADPSDPQPLSTDPGDEPAGCTVPACASASNALMFRFDDGSGTTVVSYRYGPSDDGEGFVLTRVACTGGSCTARVVLRDLAPPETTPWAAGDPVPDDVVKVSAANVVNGDDSDADDASAVTVSVTVNGLPDGAGVPRSSKVSITAGTVERDDLETPTFDGPSFVEARSGCGGPHTLLVDYSGSISPAEDDVRTGVESFVRAFEGTPTELHVIIFESDITTLGGVNHTYDLSEPADVTALVGSSASSTDGDFGTAYGTANGGTNWQEALELAFYNSQNGLPYDADGDPTTPMPERVILFTDGLPTVDDDAPTVTQSVYDHWRRNYSNNEGGTDQLYLRAWWRADQIAEDYRDSIDLIGVGVGAAFGRDIYLYHDDWEEWRPNRIFLGDLVAGNSPAAYDPSEGDKFKLVNGDLGWTDVAEADVLTTSDFSQLGDGLAAIALAECGGTLTVQTRDSSGETADTKVTYTLNGEEQATTSRINKAVPFDVPFDGAASADVELVPDPLDGSGYAASSWACTVGGASHPFSLLEADASGGISVTVTPNAAVSCTLTVVGS